MKAPADYRLPMISNERAFIDSAYIRLNDGSAFFRALRDGSFGPSQRSFHFDRVSEDVILERARRAAPAYSPVPFLPAAELLTALNLYRATGQNRFFELLTEAVEALLRERDIEKGYVDDLRGRPGAGWGCNYIVPGLWTHDLATSCSVGFPVSLLAWQCLLEGRKAEARRYAAVCCEIADEFSSNVVTDESGATVRQPGMQDIEPSNHAAGYVALLVMVHLLTGESRYAKLADSIVRFIKHSFRIEDGGTVCWPYRGNMEPKPSIFGERYWKSPWVITAMLLCEQSGIVFTSADLTGVARSVEANLIRNGSEIYDSLSRRAGIRLDEQRFAYHRGKGQSFSLRRLFNFTPLALARPEVLPILARAISSNPYFLTLREGAFEPENYWVLEGMSFCLDPSASAFNLEPGPWPRSRFPTATTTTSMS